MKKCIDNRITVGDPGFSQEFENFVRGVRDPVLTKKIRIRKAGIPTSLSLSEVQAFDANGLNLAQNKPSRQSSTDGTNSADKGNNGDLADFSRTKISIGK